jgi:two-component sensor histidine kinase
MIRELDHRAKNILAVIQSILRLSMREDPARYASRVQGRITALSRAQAMLSAEAWSGADLAAILRGEMMPFARQSESENRFTLDGPPLRVTAQRVQPLVLAVHELASNAYEHGAFSRPEGRLAVSWRLDEAQGVIRLFWQETGGPPVTRPARHGVGGKLLTAIIETQLHGSFVPEWHETGFAARITLPV